MAEKNRLKVFKMLDGKCFYCGCKLDFDNYHIDHFIPKAMNGGYESNLVPSCPECNLCKSDLTIEQFREKIANGIYNSFQGKILRKYFKIKPTKVKFYFERMIQDGYLPNNMFDILDGHKGN